MREGSSRGLLVTRSIAVRLYENVLDDGGSAVMKARYLHEATAVAVLLGAHVPVDFRPCHVPLYVPLALRACASSRVETARETAAAGATTDRRPTSTRTERQLLFSVPVLLGIPSSHRGNWVPYACIRQSAMHKPTSVMHMHDS